jgi:hypothetical protein
MDSSPAVLSEKPGQVPITRRASRCPIRAVDAYITLQSSHHVLGLWKVPLASVEGSGNWQAARTSAACRMSVAKDLPGSLDTLADRPAQP